MQQRASGFVADTRAARANGKAADNGRKNDAEQNNKNGAIMTER